MLTDKEMWLNRSHKNRRVDEFEVFFYHLPEDAQNFLGGQVKSISRPTVTCEKMDVRSRRGEVPHKMRPDYGPVTIEFFDDENGLTAMLLYAQLMVQSDASFPDPFKLALGRDYKFDVDVKLSDSRGNVTEGYMLRDCFIGEISHSEAIYSSSESNVIRVVLNFEDAYFTIIDRYLAQLKEKLGID